MALNWRPLGPEPAQTYWQRRALLLGAVILLLTVVVVLLTRGGGSGNDRLAGGTPAASPVGASPDPSATPASPGTASGSPSSATCAPPALQVLTAANSESYPADGRPVLELRTTNTGPVPCTIDLGAAAVELLVFSGEDRIWSSDDCGSGGPAAPTTLEPGKAVATKVTWSGKRSLPGCTGPKAQAQPGTYRVTGRVGQLPVSGGSFRITG